MKPSGLEPVAGGGWLEKCRRVILLVCLIYAGLVLAALLGQRHLLYVPESMSMADETELARESGFQPWLDSEGHLMGWHLPAKGTASGVSNGVALIFHGNAGCAAERGYLAGPIHDATGMEVFVLEYPGYGAREGTPSRRSLDLAARKAFQSLPASKPCYLVSESIGTGVAGDLAEAFPDRVAGIVMLAPYHDLASVAQRRLWFLPAYFLLWDRFNPAMALSHYHGPVQFVVAGADEIIGPQSGLELCRSYKGPKQLEFVQGARHNEVAEQKADWWRSTFGFLHRAVPGGH